MSAGVQDDRAHPRIGTPQFAVVATAVLLAVPATYLFHHVFLLSAWETVVGEAVLALTLAVGVPVAYVGYWPQYERTRLAVAWAVAACVAITVEFTGLYVLVAVAGEVAPPVAVVGTWLLVLVSVATAVAVR